MRIVLVATGLGMGGAEKQVVDLADEYARLGHEVLLVSLVDEVMVRPSHPAVVLHVAGMKATVQSFLRTYFSVRRLVSEFRPDVVHSHMVHANVFMRLIRVSLSFPRLMSSAHNTNEGGALRMLAYRLTDPLADLVTNVSEDAVAAFEQKKAVPPGRMMVFNNGINPEVYRFDSAERQQARAELGIPDGARLLLAIGRLTDAKDYPNLLQAVVRVVPFHPDIVVMVAGQGELRENLQQQVAEMGLAERITFLGVRRDIPRLLAAADIYVLSSAWEGMPLVILEAMASERVVVATDCGGVAEALGGTGIVVPPRDAEALASALRTALGMSEAERIHMGQLARQRVLQHYSLSAIANKWLELYQADNERA